MGMQCKDAPHSYAQLIYLQLRENGAAFLEVAWSGIEELLQVAVKRTKIGHGGRQRNAIIKNVAARGYERMVGRRMRRECSGGDERPRRASTRQLHSPWLKRAYALSPILRSPPPHSHYFCSPHDTMQVDISRLKSGEVNLGVSQA